MSFADILLSVKPGAADEPARLAVAVDLAQRFHGRLNGVFVADRSGTEGEWARALFERAISRSPLETSWRVIDGQAPGALTFQARRSDLCVLPVHPGAAGRGAGCAPDLIALNVGRPVLVLPPPASDTSTSIGHSILVGWNDTKAAARAIHDAMPILANAEKVFVMTVMENDELEPFTDRRLVEHLRQHGVSAEFTRRYGDPGEELATAARALDVDMLVIGLSSRVTHSRSVLNDVSQRFIRTAVLPVFCSH